MPCYWFLHFFVVVSNVYTANGMHSNNSHYTAKIVGCNSATTNGISGTDLQPDTVEYYSKVGTSTSNHCHCKYPFTAKESCALAVMILGC